MSIPLTLFFFFFFNDTATTEIYTLSLHDALPISPMTSLPVLIFGGGEFSEREKATMMGLASQRRATMPEASSPSRSEEHTSELQSPDHLVCRLLLEKKKKKNNNIDDEDRV